MKKFTKKIGALMSGLLPIISVTGKANAMIERPVTPNYKTVIGMIREAWNDDEKTFADKLKHPINHFQAKYGMYPVGPGKLGLRALNTISNHPKMTATIVSAPIVLSLASKYGAFDKLGEIVKNRISGDQTQFEDYNNQENDDDQEDGEPEFRNDFE